MQAEGALISSAGTIIPGEAFDFPPLEQEEQIVPFEELYNQVFGKNYEFLYLEDTLTQLLQKASEGTATSPKLLFANTDNTLELYYDRIDGLNRQGLVKATYRGNYLSDILSYIEFANAISKDKGFQDYLRNVVGDVIEAEELSQKTQELTNIKNQCDEFKIILGNTTKSEFSRATQINNTTTPIDFSKFTEKFMPDGVEPIVPCYVEDCGARNIDYKYFDTGYYCMVDICLVYIDSQGQVVVEERENIVAALNNQESSESIYNRLLTGEEDMNYIISNTDKKIVENPILTGNTSGITAQEGEVKLSK